MRGTLDRFFTHFSVDSIVTVPVEFLGSLPLCGLTCFGWPPLQFEWTSLVCFYNLLIFFLCPSIMLACLDSLYCADDVNLFIYPIFLFIHTCIPLVCANIYSAFDGSDSLVGQLLLCSFDDLNPLHCSDVALKLKTGRGDILT